MTYEATGWKRFWHNIASVKASDIRSKFIFHSYATMLAEKQRQYTKYPFSIHPYSALRYWIEVFFVVIMITTYLMIALEFSDLQEMWVVSCLILDCLYMLIIITNFFTGYVVGDTEPTVVLDLKMISCRYLKTWFFVDVLSCCILMLAIFPIKNVLVVILMNFMKLLRIPLLFMFFKNILRVLQVKAITAAAMKIFLYIYLYLTWNIFFQFASEYFMENSFRPKNPRNCSWITQANLWNSTRGTRFVYGFYRALYMIRCSDRVGLVLHDKICNEHFYVISWIVAKVVALASTVMFMLALWGTESAKGRYYIMAMEVENFAKQRKLPPRIKEKLLKLYAIRFQSHFFVESLMLSCVSGQLREDIVMHSSRQLVQGVHFLKQVPRELLFQICMKLTIVVAIAGDVILKINNVGDCMYFIDKGTVAVYSASGKEVCHLEDGDFFGEIALTVTEGLRTASVVAVTNCELFKLSTQDFESSVACYPTVYEEIKRVATDRFERTCVLNENHKAEMKTFEKDHNLSKEIFY